MSGREDWTALPLTELCDDGGSPLRTRLITTAHIADTVARAVADGWAVMPAGGLTSAIGSFTWTDAQAESFTGVMAIRPKSAPEPELVSCSTPPEAVLTHQMWIDPDGGKVCVGAGLTFAQANASLAQALGPTARLLVDLTSVASAMAGGVVATGGMGPLRLRPSATLDSVVLADGGPPRCVDPATVEGLQGWTGMVCAVLMRFARVPAAEFGLVLPVQGNDVDTLAGLLAWLDRWTVKDIPTAGQSLATDSLLLNGIEWVTLNSLKAFVAQASDPARTKAEHLIQSCEYAGADGMACLTGWSDLSLDDVLFTLMDPETETIGGVPIDFGVGFSSGAEMETFRAIRESAPDLARTRARVPQEGFLRPWSTSTDINICVSPADGAALAAVLTAYADYRAAIAALARELEPSGVIVELSSYGHLSPLGLDPHHRVTLFAPKGQDAAAAGVRQAVLACKRTLVRDLLYATERYGGAVTGGEKGAPSLLEIAKAAGGENRLPTSLRRATESVWDQLKQAPAAFAFRAPRPS